MEHIKAGHVDAFGKVLRKRLLAKDTGLAKSYLGMLVDEIVVKDNEATLTGSYTAIAETLHQTKMDRRKQVPTFMRDWRPEGDESGHWREVISI